MKHILRTLMVLISFQQLYSEQLQTVIQGELSQMRKVRLESLRLSGGWNPWLWPTNAGYLTGAEPKLEGLTLDWNLIGKLGYFFSQNSKPFPHFPSEQSLLSFPFHMSWGEYLQVYLAVEVQKDPFAWIDQGDSQVNLPLSVGEANFNFPFYSGLSVGLPGWNLQWGRGLMSYGPGKKGSLLVGPGIGPQDYVLFHGYGPHFSLHLSWIQTDNFATPALAPGDPPPDYGFLPASPDELTGESKFYGNHGFEFRLSPEFRFGFGEVSSFTLEQPDFKYLNPTLLVHNYFLNNSNSDLYIQAEWRLLPGHSLYGQFLMDYMRTWFKNDVYQDTRPGAFGYMAGYEGLFSVDSNLINAGVEIFYTDPFLYQDENQPMTGQRRVNSNYMGREGQKSGSRIIDFPLGWDGGPDTLQISVWTELIHPVFQGLEFTYTLTGKGERSIRDAYLKGPEAAALVAPSGTPEWSHDGGIGHSFEVFSGLSLKSTLHSVYKIQKNHVPGLEGWEWYGSFIMEWKLK